MYIIDFLPPVIGVDSEFNTFRLGMKWYSLVQPGDKVIVTASKQRIALGLAEITYTDRGDLAAMLQTHASKNHTQLTTDPNDAPEALYGVLLRCYGPQMVNLGKKTTVIGLRMLEKDFGKIISRHFGA